MRNLREVKSVLLVVALLSTVAVGAQAAEKTSATSVAELFSQGSAAFKFRYRFEGVDQSGFEKEAAASTLLSRLSWTSGNYNGISLGAEVDNVSLIGGDPYNSTTNGHARYPVVADPEGFDLNQAYLKWTNSKATLTGGRQRIVFADQRFVGGVAWRQNEQTYDAVRAQVKAADRLSLDYSYVWNVNRIFGPDNGAQPSDWDSDSHLLNADFKLAENQSLKGYIYLLDFSNDNGVPNSSATYGVSYQGAAGPLKLDLGVALQNDYGANTRDFEAHYIRANASYALKTEKMPLTFKVGYEVLGSDDGEFAFRTPLATLHAFQGFADKFLVTPADGIEDLNLGVKSKLGKLGFTLTWHDFKANEGSDDYGSEINLVATYPVSKRTKLLFKFADYKADDFATDTTKVWFMVDVRL